MNDKLTGNDAVIGKAFRYSVAVFLLLGVVVAMVFAYPYLFAKDVQPSLDVQARAPQQRLEPRSSSPTWVEPKFIDVTELSGIDFVHQNGAFGERLLPETMGGGVALFDFDQDEDIDILFTGSNYWPWDPKGRSLEQTLALYQNDGQGNFSRVDKTLGLITSAYGMGTAIADFNADGFPDIFLTHVGRNQLFVNQQGKGFVEQTDLAGVAGEGGWSTAAAWFDYDLDGWLDLVVGDYVEWNPELDREVNYSLAGIGRAYGPPGNFPGTRLSLFRNLGNGHFEDVSESAGIVVEQNGNPIGKSLAILPIDINLDGRYDLIVANDTTRNFAFINTAQGFDEKGEELGLAFDNTGKATGAMGLDALHAGNELGWSVAIANFANEMTSFYVQFDANSGFSDDAAISGIGAKTREALGFSLFFFDYDLDGGLDLFQTNGHVETEINRVQPSQSYLQAPQLFHACTSSQCTASYEFISKSQMGSLAQPVAGRGAAYGDLDGDGDLDLVLAQVNDAAKVYRNETETGPWLRIRLIGLRPNPDAIGAKVILRSQTAEQHQFVMPFRGYLSQMELPLTFGLGQQQAPFEITIVWPDGSIQTQTVTETNQVLRISQATDD